MKKLATTACLLMLFIGVYAQLPKTLSFQGYLTSDADEPITNNSLSVSFALFTTSSGGTAVWGPEPQTIAVDRGIFSTTLGTTEPLNVSAELQFDQAYFLEIVVDGEALSRIAVTPGMYSLSTINAANITTNSVAIANGGTNATTASEARTNLGLAIGTDVQAFDADLTTYAGITPSADVQAMLGSSTNTALRTNIGLGSIATQDASTVNISGGTIAGITDLAIADGGTGAGTAEAARTNLGLGSMAIQSASAVSITGGSVAGITDVTIADGGTGASTIGDAQANLNLEPGVDVQAYDADLSTYASITPASDVQTLLGSATNTAIRSNIGLGSIATQNADGVTISGGSISGITDLAIADGGTGAGTAAGARTNLGVAIGTDVQAFDDALDDISGLAVTDGNIIIGNGTSWVAESGATARASLGLTVGTQVQAYDAGLNDIASLATNDGNFIVGNGSTWITESAATARASLGLTVGSQVQAYDADLADLANKTVDDLSIGNTDQVTISSAGYTQLGSTGVSVSSSNPTGATASYPSVKMVQIEGTTASSQGSSATINLSGLIASSILSIQLLVEYGTGDFMPPSFTSPTGYEYTFNYANDILTIRNSGSNSSSILSKPFKAIIIYSD